MPAVMGTYNKLTASPIQCTSSCDGGYIALSYMYRMLQSIFLKDLHGFHLSTAEIALNTSQFARKPLSIFSVLTCSCHRQQLTIFYVHK